MGKQTMTLNLTNEEMNALNVLASEHGMSKTAVMRQALRLYQLVYHRAKNGEEISFSGDAQRTADFIGVGFPMPNFAAPNQEPGNG